MSGTVCMSIDPAPQDGPTMDVPRDEVDDAIRMVIKEDVPARLAFDEDEFEDVPIVSKPIVSRKRSATQQWAVKGSSTLPRKLADHKLKVVQKLLLDVEEEFRQISEKEHLSTVMNRFDTLFRDLDGFLSNDSWRGKHALYTNGA